MSFTKETLGTVESVGGVSLFDSLRTIGLATQETPGIISASDKKKLDGIQENANNYKHPDSGVVPGEYLRVEVDEQGHVTNAWTMENSTLAEHGITDAHINPEDNTITLGANTVVPLTADDELQADKINGIVDLKNLPIRVVKHCVIVEDNTARFALTAEDVQNGDTVKVVNPVETMYMVVDETKLDSEDGYSIYVGTSNKIAGSAILLSNLEDGEILTYRADSNTWRNESKSAIGAGKALAIYYDNVLQVEYSGEARATVELSPFVKDSDGDFMVKVVEANE